MATSLELLHRRYDRPCLTLEEVRAEWFPEISLDSLMEEIHAGQIKLRYTRLRPSRKAQPVVYLHDLARYLDSQDPSTTQPAADQAA